MSLANRGGTLPLEHEWEWLKQARLPRKLSPMVPAQARNAWRSPELLLLRNPRDRFLHHLLLYHRTPPMLLVDGDRTW